MVLNAKKFEKLAKKVNKKLIGEFGTKKALGIDVTANKYAVTQNNRGDQTKVFDSKQEFKGIVIRSIDGEVSTAGELTVVNTSITLYIPNTVQVVATEGFAYEFVVKGQIYLLHRHNGIGQVSNMENNAVVTEITLQLKPLA